MNKPQGIMGSVLKTLAPSFWQPEQAATVLPLGAASVWDRRARLVDLSKYNTGVDVKKMVSAGGIAGIIARAGDGYGCNEDTNPVVARVDLSLAGFVQQAYEAGIPCGAYWFFRPDMSQGVTPETDDQFRSFEYATRGKVIHFMVIDLEFAGGETNTNIAAKVKKFANWLWDLYKGKPLFFYTGNYWLQQYSPALIDWLGSQTDPKNMWMAQWIWSTPKVKTAWSDIWTNKQPADAQKIPTPGFATWKLWQWATAFYGMEGAGIGEIDLNYYNGTKEDLYAFVHFKPGVPIPEPPPPTPGGDLEARVAELEKWRASLQTWHSTYPK